MGGWVVGAVFSVGGRGLGLVLSRIVLRSSCSSMPTMVGLGALILARKISTSSCSCYLLPFSCFSLTHAHTSYTLSDNTSTPLLPPMPHVPFNRRMLPTTRALAAASVEFLLGSFERTAFGRFVGFRTRARAAAQSAVWRRDRRWSGGCCAVVLAFGRFLRWVFGHSREAVGCAAVVVVVEVGWFD